MYVVGYVKTITYGDVVEIYQYEKDVRYHGRNGKRIRRKDGGSDLASSVSNSVLSPEQRAEKRKDNARRSAMVFRRLVSANLGEQDCPLLVSLTYAENIEDIGRAHKDFNSFARNVRAKFGKGIRYIAVPEFQKRGAVHFHALFWGLDSKTLAESERRTRLVAKMWGQGFVDLVVTDGNHKISGYLSKYMAKTFCDSRLKGKKAYISSQNIKRPVVEKNALIEPLFYGDLEDVPDLSTASLLKEKLYDTVWLGRGRYRLYKTN